MLSLPLVTFMAVAKQLYFTQFFIYEKNTTTTMTITCFYENKYSEYTIIKFSVVKAKKL
jgi:hypothetical protein